MKDFVFHNPTKIVFGKDKVLEIGKEIKSAGYNKVLLAYGQSSIKKTGTYDKVVSSLNKENIKYVELSGIKPNPIFSKVLEGIEICKKENIETILAVGGGSVVDSVKAIAGGVFFDGDFWQVFQRKARVEKALPVFVVLTLSATGSEMNPSTVVTNEQGREKFYFTSTAVYPKVSILDPVLQFSLPDYQTSAGASDIIAHIFELYFCGEEETELQDEFSEGITRTVIHFTPILLEKPDDYHARAQMILSALFALNGVNGIGREPGDWSSHMLEHALSGIHPEIAHGAGLAIIFPAWLKYMMPYVEKKITRFSKKIWGIDNPDAGIQRLKEWFGSIGLEASFKDFGIKEDEIPILTEMSVRMSPFGSLKTLDARDVETIFSYCF